MEKLSFREKFSYSASAMGKDMAYMLSSTYVLYYYEDLLGVNAIVMGIILLAARFFDAFNDPVMGMIVARTRTRWGRFRPWMMAGAVLNGIVLYLMFSAPPALDGAGLAAYAAVFYILWGMTYTLVDIPFWSLIPFLTGSGREREKLTALARSCAGVGSAIVAVLTMLAVPRLGGGSEASGFSRFSLIVALIFMLLMAFACGSIHEKSTADLEAPSVRELFRALFRNDQALTVVAAVVLINISTQTTLSLLIYFFKYDIGGENWNDAYVLFAAFGGAMQILSMMIFYPLARKLLGTIRLFRLSCMMALAGYLILLILMMNGLKSVFALMVPGFLVFTASGFLTVLTTVFLADAVDYGEVRNHHRDESMIFSMQTFAAKLAGGVSAFIVSVCLFVCHLSRNTDAAVPVPAGEGSLTVLRLTMSLLPLLGFAVTLFLFIRHYTLTEAEMAGISRELKERRAEG